VAGRQPLPPGVARRFRTGRPSLDLVHTGGEGVYAVFELLHGAADVDRWLAHLLGVDTVRAVGGDVAATRTLREAVRAAAAAAMAADALPPGAVATINAAAAAAPPVPVLGADGTAAPAPPVTAAQARSLLARDAIDLLTGPLAARIRVCAAPDCGLLFVDASRPGRRRWCSMERCGNRAKTRGYRSRSSRSA
jgi:predicted RNA-binding Zn ribbon-like protein